MEASELIGKAQQLLKDKVLKSSSEGDIPHIKVEAKRIKSVLSALKEDKELDLNWLEFLTFSDFPQENKLEGLYLLYSLKKRHKLGVKIDVERDKSEVSSIAELWEGAAWHENEAYDLFGITFKGHPDPRRILTAEGFEGYPLRKDFTHPDMLSPACGGEEEHERGKPTPKADSAMRMKKTK